MLYKARNSFIELFDDYSLVVSEVKLKATKRTSLNILTSKQKLQVLSTDLVSIKRNY